MRNNEFRSFEYKPHHLDGCMIYYFELDRMRALCFQFYSPAAQKNIFPVETCVKPLTGHLQLQTKFSHFLF